MKKFFLITTFFALISMSCSGICCTTMLITKNATADGSILVAHSDDDEVGDQRIIYVPAMDHPKGSKRPVYPDGNATYPRYVGKSRGPGYDIPDYPPTQPIGYIDQVPHTYAFFDANYGIINEHQLALGECTNAANVDTTLTTDTKDRLFCIGELSRIALERCKKAREAIALIGELADEYGYNGWGETLLIADTEEGWVFEICNPPNGRGAIWVAKKVPDGEVFVAANEFRIREVMQDDPNIMYSKQLFPIAKKQGWWDPKSKKPLDWLTSVSPGEYNHPYYCLRRVWRAFSRIAPSLNLSPWVEDGYTRDYPFSIEPDKKLNVQDVMALYRDYYQGTEFDLTKGLAAGPFGCANRFFGPYDTTWNNHPGKKNSKLEGAWERPISVYYCGYVYVNQIRDHLPDPIGGVCWLGLDQPYTNCFVPYYIGVSDLPKPLQITNSYDFSFDGAWWIFNFVSNWSSQKFDFMIKDIQALQTKLEEEEFRNQANIEHNALKLYQNGKDLKRVKEYLTQYCKQNAHEVFSQWAGLSKYLVEKYTDGYINRPKIGQAVGYPKWWREAVGYQNGPKSYKKPEAKD